MNKIYKNNNGIYSTKDFFSGKKFTRGDKNTKYKLNQKLSNQHNRLSKNKMRLRAKIKQLELKNKEKSIFDIHIIDNKDYNTTINISNIDWKIENNSYSNLEALSFELLSINLDIPQYQVQENISEFTSEDLFNKSNEELNRSFLLENNTNILDTLDVNYRSENTRDSSKVIKSFCLSPFRSYNANSIIYEN